MPRRKQTSTPQAADRLAADARGLWSRHRYPEALHAFERAARAAPDDATIAADAARALGAAYRLDEALRLLTDAEARHTHDPHAMLLIGQTSRMIGRPRDAERRLAAAAALDPSLDAAWLELAVLFERWGRLDEAVDAAERCLRLVPGSAEAGVLRARLDRRDGALDDAATRLEKLLQGGPDPSTESLAWAELARVHDTCSRYDRAWDAMLRSKAWVLGHRDALTPQAATETRRFDALADAFEQAEARPGAHAPPSPRRAALLLGLPRSGTTLLNQALARHPGVLSTDEQPILPRFILPHATGPAQTADQAAQSLARVNDRQRRRLADDYWRRVESWHGEPLGDRLHIDKNPGLVGLIPAIERVLPDAHYLYTRRDPRDLLLSCLMQPLPPNTISLRFCDPIDAARWIADTDGLWCRLRDRLPAERVVEVQYEAYVADPAATRRAVLAAVGLNADAPERAEADTLVQSPTYEAVTQAPHQRRVSRWRHYERWLADALPLLPE